MKVKYKRLVAYLIDTLFISFIVSLFMSSSLMKYNMESYNNTVDEVSNYYQELMNKITDEDIEEIDLEEDKLKDLLHDMSVYSIPSTAINVICVVLYFVVFQFFNHGQTIGKRLLKIKVVDKDGNELSLSNMLIRTVILYNVIFNIINMLIVQFAAFNVFVVSSLIISSLTMIIYLFIIFMILFRKDEKGLHDFLSSSKVIEV